MSTKTPEQRAEERIPWDQATIDAVGLPYDGVHNTRDIARAAYAAAIRELVEPRDRILQEMVDSLGSFKRYSERETMNSEDEDAILDNCDLVLAKAKEQFGITPKP